MTRADIISVLKGAGVAASGAALTYLTTWATGADLGSATPIVVAALSVVANLVRKWAAPTVETQ